MNENEALILNDLNIQNNINDAEILNIIENDDKIDLIDIQANDLLTEIKRMIKVDFSKTKSDKIDADFIKSLKRIMIISNNNITKEYLKKLSYMYFALYNDTLDVYYEIQKSGQQLEYYMLDEKYNNNIMLVKDYDWSKYNCPDILRKAYYNNCLEQVLSIVNVNPYFFIRDVANKYLEPDFLDNIINIFGLERIAKSNLESIVLAINEINLQYTMDLMKINPDIAFNCKYIFNDAVKESASISEIAFLNDISKKGLQEIIRECWYKSNLKQMVTYYFNIIQYSPEFVFDWSKIKISNLEMCVEKKDLLLPSVFAKMTEAEHKIFHSYKNASTLIEVTSFNRYIDKLEKQYGESIQKKLVK